MDMGRGKRHGAARHGRNHPHRADAHHHITVGHRWCSTSFSWWSSPGSSCAIDAAPRCSSWWPAPQRAAGTDPQERGRPHPPRRASPHPRRRTQLAVGPRQQLAGAVRRAAADLAARAIKPSGQLALPGAGDRPGRHGPAHRPDRDLPYLSRSPFPTDLLASWLPAGNGDYRTVEPCSFLTSGVPGGWQQRATLRQAGSRSLRFESSGLSHLQGASCARGHAIRRSDG